MKKLFSLKETRLYIALSLLVQSFAFFIMFIIALSSLLVNCRFSA